MGTVNVKKLNYIISKNKYILKQIKPFKDQIFEELKKKCNFLFPFEDPEFPTDSNSINYSKIGVERNDPEFPESIRRVKFCRHQIVSRGSKFLNAFIMKNYWLIFSKILNLIFFKTLKYRPSCYYF